MAIFKAINKSTTSHRAMKNCIAYVLKDMKIKDGFVYLTGPAPEQIDSNTIYNAFLERDFKPRRLKNTMALIKQFLKYCKAEGIIKNYTNFYVKRLTEKNEYSLDRIIFEV